MVVSILIAAGSGTRMGGDVPKQFMDLGGIPVFLHVLHRLDGIEEIAAHVCVLQPEYRQFVDEALASSPVAKPLHFAEGGHTRQETCYSGILVADDLGAELVVVQEAVRPFTSSEVIEAAIEDARKSGAAVCGVPVFDSAVLVEEGQIAVVPDKSAVSSLQTPEVFRTSLILRAHRKALKEGFETEAEWGLAHYLGEPVVVTPGSHFNIKLTTPADMLVARTYLAEGYATDCRKGFS